MMILRYESNGFCGFSVCWHINSVNRLFASTTPICPLNVAWPSRQRSWNCPYEFTHTNDIKSQEQMRRAQIYKRLIAACNPIALLAQVWHQKSIWGCLTADKSATAERICGAWTINILSILEILLCLKCLLCRWIDMPFLFSWHSAYRQHTYHSVCSERRIYGEIVATATKSTKTIAIWIYHASYIMGKSELSAFCTLCSNKMRKMCKVHTPKVVWICLLSLLRLLSNKKPKRCKSHITIITECEKTRRTAQHAELNLSPPKSVSVYHDLIYFIWVGKSAEVWIYPYSRAVAFGVMDCSTLDHIAVFCDRE